MGRHGINALIDLTTATTPTSVVQTRGRVLRLDPGWPEKTANTWTVVCTTDRHPKGAADWERFVRKHTGYLVAAPDGEIVSGVAHVDASFSPYAPPETGSFDALNTRMLERAQDRAATRAVWRLGSEYRDELVHTVRVHAARAVVPAKAELEPVPGRPEPPSAVPAPNCAAPVPSQPPPPARLSPLSLLGGSRRSFESPMRTQQAVPWYLAANAVVVAGYVVLGLAGGVWLHEVWTLLGVVFVLYGWLVILEERWRKRRSGRVCGRTGRGHEDRLREHEALVREHLADTLDTAAGDPSVTRLAYAIADALVTCDLSERGADAVTVRLESDGSYQLSLAGVDTATSERFAVALDEVLSPMAMPRYVIPRYVVRVRTGEERLQHAQAWGDGHARADEVVYHAVPAVFGQNRRLAKEFEKAWNTWISRGSALFTSSPEGEGILAAHRGEDPFAATTALRVAWD
ncbi:hypothetical protein [Allosalinactinospora lopnorensis]|uniref:hypothetical protein n=1 Tax=Allosalinactinospora lopnorensis TaxID=1352348 RepID=UPI0006973793|nr:hypothetical protein [Allosalinactinospora lopnorensis]